MVVESFERSMFYALVVNILSHVIFRFVEVFISVFDGFLHGGLNYFSMYFSEKDIPQLCSSAPPEH